jgi:hypothetical protein
LVVRANGHQARFHFIGLSPLLPVSLPSDFGLGLARMIADGMREGYNSLMEKSIPYFHAIHYLFSRSFALAFRPIPYRHFRPMG